MSVTIPYSGQDTRKQRRVDAKCLGTQEDRGSGW